MKSENTSSRLKQIMAERHLKQVDILNLAKPFCEDYNVKLGRNDLSQYLSGRVEPGQWKLSILGLALNVSEAWLMGYDVPIDREKPAPVSESGLSEQAIEFAKAIDKLPDSYKDELWKKILAAQELSKDIE